MPRHPPPVTDQESKWLGFDPGKKVSIVATVIESPVATLTGAERASEKLLVMATAAEASFEGSARLRAVKVTMALFGKIGGAVKLPRVSTVPHSDGHTAPERVQRTAVSGCPLLPIDAWKFWTAPSSRLAEPGVSATVRSLVIVTAALADFAGSAWLAALISTVATDGRCAGAQ